MCEILSPSTGEWVNLQEKYLKIHHSSLQCHMSFTHTLARDGGDRRGTARRSEQHGIAWRVLWQGGYTVKGTSFESLAEGVLFSKSLD